MNYIYDIVLRFIPPELTGSAADSFLGFGCALLIGVLVFVFYKIVRIFI